METSLMAATVTLKKGIEIWKIQKERFAQYWKKKQKEVLIYC